MPTIKINEKKKRIEKECTEERENSPLSTHSVRFRASTSVYSISAQCENVRWVMAFSFTCRHKKIYQTSERPNGAPKMKFFALIHTSDNFSPSICFSFDASSFVTWSKIILWLETISLHILRLFHKWVPNDRTHALASLINIFERSILLHAENKFQAMAMFNLWLSSL